MELTMAYQIILTCGTSQLREDKLTGKKTSLGLKLDEIGYKDLNLSPYNSEDINLTLDWLESNERQWPVAQISDKLEQLINNGGIQLVGKGEDNPNGAELSTLMVLFNEAQEIQALEPGYFPNYETRFLGDPHLQPKNNSFHLICSHTQRGLFAAGIIQKVVTDLGWGTAEINMVNGLCEDPIDPNLALQHLAEAIISILDNSDLAEGKLDMPTLFAITGGFKSSIPCMTLSSIIFNIPMIYLFEDSKKLQILSSFSTGTIEKKCHKPQNNYWKNISELRIYDEIPWFKALLDFKISHLYKVWFHT